MTPGRYEVAGVGTWRDAKIKCGPAGYESPGLLFRLVERFRRVREAPWFELIVAVDGRSGYHRVGDRAELDIDAAGELIAFANDLKWMYWNNCGTIDLLVRRLS